MAFMKKDVNFGLLILIIASILLFSGFSVYYQITFRKVSTEYQDKLEQLEKVTTELATQKRELNETYSLRIKAEQDRKALDKSYKDISDENAQLESDNSFLKDELSVTKMDLAERKAELEATKNLLQETQSSLDEAGTQVSSLKLQVTRLENDIKDICDYIEDEGFSKPSDCD